MRITFDRTQPGRMAEVDAPHQIVGDLLEQNLQFSDGARERLLAWLASPGPPDEDGPPRRGGNAVGIEHHGGTVTVEHDYDGAPTTTLPTDELAWAVRQWGDFLEGRLGRRATVEGP